MKNDELCKYFSELRTQIVKKGELNLNYISLVNYSTNHQRPNNSEIRIKNNGFPYYLVNVGSPQEDERPAPFIGSIKTQITFKDIINKNGQIIAKAPKTHLGKDIKTKDIFKLMTLYYNGSSVF